MDIKISIKDNCLKILISNTVHLMIKQDELVGIQAWIKGDEVETYWIEYTLRDRELLCSYNEKNKWGKILMLLNDAKLFNEKL